MKNIKTYTEFINESKTTWKVKGGVTEFDIHGNTYSLYFRDYYELYKYSEDYGMLIMRFKIENKKMIFYYGAFDLDLVSSAYKEEIMDAMKSYFKLNKNSEIIYRN